MSTNKEELLVYWQDNVQLMSGGDCMPKLGTLNIIKNEMLQKVSVEWKCTEEETPENEWDVISSASVSLSTTSSPEKVTMINNKTVSVETFDVHTIEKIKIDNRKSLTEIWLSDRIQKPTFIFLKGHVRLFFEALLEFIAITETNVADEYRVLNKDEVCKDEAYAALDLVHGHIPHSRSIWAGSHRVMGFIHNMSRDPYRTTVSALSKISEAVLYNQETEPTYTDKADDLAKVLHDYSISSMGDIEPGFEILTKSENLAERPTVHRMTALSHSEFEEFLEDGRIRKVDELKMRIFKGGIQTNMRKDLWKYLIGPFDWEMNIKQKEKCIRDKREAYFIMNQQWKSMSQIQEKYNAKYREHKSLIEKDVNRTDRNHPFYEDESNLKKLSDILLTYVMYNFDLGYVQGMSDLLAPILYVIEEEAMAFWCFVGFMDRVHNNFEFDQSGMKQQLHDLSNIMRLVNPELMSYLEANDSANLYFCFRWILVRFKRELSYSDTLRLWEVLWTDIPCNNFHLLLAAAILDSSKEKIVSNKFNFPEIIRHVNNLSLNINLTEMMEQAESIHIQLAESNNVPLAVRKVLQLPSTNDFYPNAAAVTATPSFNSNRDIDSQQQLHPDSEKQFEASLSHSYI